jgi:hypothetical protein
LASHRDFDNRQLIAMFERDFLSGCGDWRKLHGQQHRKQSED